MDTLPENPRYIKVLDINDTQKLYKFVIEECIFENINSTSISKGDRTVSINNINDIKIVNLYEIIHDIFPLAVIKPLIRIYHHKYGVIVPHRDRSSYNNGNTTFLIYLNEFEGGELHLNNNGNDISYKPLPGYGVVFSKDILHWTGDVFESKYILIIDMMIDN